MPNTSRLYRYQGSSTDNTAVRNFFVRADTSASTLTLDGQANAEAPGLAANQTFGIVLQGRGGPKSNLSHARTVVIVMTAAAGPLSVGSRATIPVFRETVWQGYREGQTGAYLGGACRCVGKRDGAPNVSGMFS